MADHRSALDRLAEPRGLGSVSAHIERLRWQVEAERKLGGRAEPTARHLVFTGNPGTGKTTVAHLVGEIYRDLGVLRRGHVVAAEAAELIADHVGGTAKATNRKVDEALDGVLLIDEAYRLGRLYRPRGRWRGCRLRWDGQPGAGLRRAVLAAPAHDSRRRGNPLDRRRPRWHHARDRLR